MAFITQRAKTHHAANRKMLEETQALEALVCGVNAVSQSTLLLKKKKEMHEVDDALDFMKDEYKLRVEACEQRQRKFERRQADMKDQVAKFEKFIQENDSKRQRADAKARSETRLRDQKLQEQGRMRADLARLERERAAQLAQLERLRAYREYLERTVEAAGDEAVEEVWDLLNRHTTLRNANVDLMDQVQRGDGETDALRSRMDALRLRTQSSALVQNSRIHAKQKDLEALRAAAKQRDDSKHAQEDRVKDVTRETAQIVLAVRNLYARCLATMHTRVAAISFANEEQRPEADRLHRLGLCLDLICERLCDLEDIRANHERERKEAIAAGR